MKKVLLIGATGLVGTGIGKVVLNAGYRVVGTSRRKLISYHDNFVSCRLDLADESSICALQNEIESADAIIFNAAQITPDIEADFLGCWVNVSGLGSLLRRCSNKKKFVFISTQSIKNHAFRTDPSQFPFYLLGPYQLSKCVSEALIASATLGERISSTTLRVRAPYGYTPTSLAVIPRFIDAVRNDRDITILGTGSRRQFFTFVEDIGYASLLALNGSYSGYFDIQGQECVTMSELAALIIESRPSSCSRIVLTGDPDPLEGENRADSPNNLVTLPDFSPQVLLREGLKRIHSYLDGDLRLPYSVAV